MRPTSESLTAMEIRNMRKSIGFSLALMALVIGFPSIAQ